MSNPAGRCSFTVSLIRNSSTSDVIFGFSICVCVIVSTMGKWRIPHKDVKDLHQWCNRMLSCVLVEVMTLHRNVNFSCCLLPGSGLSSTRRLVFLINSWVLSGCVTLSWKDSAVSFHRNELSITKQKFIDWTCHCVYNLRSSRFLKNVFPQGQYFISTISFNPPTWVLRWELLVYLHRQSMLFSVSKFLIWFWQ